MFPLKFGSIRYISNKGSYQFRCVLGAFNIVHDEIEHYDHGGKAQNKNFRWPLSQDSINNINETKSWVKERKQCRSMFMNAKI